LTPELRYTAITCIRIRSRNDNAKSHVKVRAAQYEAALKKGAPEIKPGAVIYKQGGKLYMMEDSANEKASQNFQSNFDVDY
jgi:hypothetical protein